MQCRRQWQSCQSRFAEWNSALIYDEHTSARRHALCSATSTVLHHKYTSCRKHQLLMKINIVGHAKISSPDLGVVIDTESQMGQARFVCPAFFSSKPVVCRLARAIAPNEHASRRWVKHDWRRLVGHSAVAVNAQHQHIAIMSYEAKVAVVMKVACARCNGRWFTSVPV